MFTDPAHPVVSIRRGVWSLCLAAGSYPIAFVVLWLGGWIASLTTRSGSYFDFLYAWRVFGIIAQLLLVAALVASVVLGGSSIALGRRGYGRARATSAIVLGSVGVAVAVGIGLLQLVIYI